MKTSSTPTSSYRTSATYSTYPSTPPGHTSTSTSGPAVVDKSAPASGTFNTSNANMLSTSRTITTDCIGYKSVIDKARAIQKEDAKFLYEVAKVRHADKLRRAKEGRERADEAALRIASSSNLNIDNHYQQLLVEIKENVKATFEAEWIAEVREDVYRRYPQIASEYEAEIRDETYTFLVDSLEPLVKADLRQQFEQQIREELREELKAEVRSELSAQHEVKKTDCPQVPAGSGHVHSKAVQTDEETTEVVIDPSSPTIRAHTEILDVNVGANDIIVDLDRELAEEVSASVREVVDEVDREEGSCGYDAQIQRPELACFGKLRYNDANAPDNTHENDLNVAQSQRPQSPLMDSVEIKEEDGSATPYDDRYEDQSASRSRSVGSKRSWSSEEDYEENESPSKRRKYSPENEDETVPWPFDDEQHANHFQQQGSASPPSSDDYFDSEDEEHQDVITPGPFVQLAPQFGQPGSLIAQTNTADEAWVIPDSDDEEGVKGEVDGGETLVETGFVSVNKGGINVGVNDLFLNEGDDGQL